MEPEPNTTDSRCRHDAKTSLRRAARALRQAIPAEEKDAASRAVAERVLALPEIKGATAVLVYGASPEEVDPHLIERSLRERGVRIAYPRVTDDRTLGLHWVEDADALATGAFGLKEPTPDTPVASLDDIDAIIVPGVAFDGSCNRLGFGGGFYDGLLGCSLDLPPTIGLAFDEQVVAEVPCEEHDRPVDVVVTPTQTIRRPTRSL